MLQETSKTLKTQTLLEHSNQICNRDLLTSLHCSICGSKKYIRYNLGREVWHYSLNYSVMLLRNCSSSHLQVLETITAHPRQPRLQKLIPRNVHSSRLSQNTCASSYNASTLQKTVFGSEHRISGQIRLGPNLSCDSFINCHVHLYLFESPHVRVCKLISALNKWNGFVCLHMPNLCFHRFHIYRCTEIWRWACMDFNCLNYIHFWCRCANFCDWIQV